MKPDPISVSELAQITGISASNLHALIDTGNLSPHAEKMGRPTFDYDRLDETLTTIFNRLPKTNPFREENKGVVGSMTAKCAITAHFPEVAAALRVDALSNKIQSLS